MPGNKITLVGIYCIKRNVSMGKVNPFLRKKNFIILVCFSSSND